MRKNIAVIGQMTTLNKEQLLVKVGSIQGTVYAGQVKMHSKTFKLVIMDNHI